MSEETLESLVADLIALSPEREEETRQVIFQISQCNIDDDIVASRVFNALKNMVQNSDLQSAEIASDSLLLLVSIQAKFETSKTSEFTEFLANYLEGCAHDIRYFAARAVFLNAKSLEWSVSEILLNYASAGRDHTANIIDQIDYSIANIFDSDMREEALEWLTKFIKQRGERNPLRMFGAIRHRIMSGSATELGAVLVYWFEDGAFSLGMAAIDLMTERAGDKVEINADAPFASLNATERLFVVRKAIGFLFWYPHAAVSLVLSAFRAADEPELPELERQLFESIGVSYGSIVQQLQEVPENDDAYMSAGRVLEKMDDYVDGLRGTEGVNALTPSALRRQIQNEKWHDMMSEKMGETRKDSLLQMFPSSVILYGDSALSYFEDGEGETQSATIPMHAIEHQQEAPRLGQLDAAGLEHMLVGMRWEAKQ